MRYTRARAAWTAGLLAVAGTAAGVTLAAAPASAGPAAAPQVVLVQCHGQGQVKPSSTDRPGCMHSNEFIDSMKWTSWRSVAYGSGVYRVNNCTPSGSCGPAQFTKYPMLIVLWRAEAWPGHSGRDYFTRMTVIFDTTKRPHGPVAQTMTLSASNS
jgi:hypothetical protein